MDPGVDLFCVTGPPLPRLLRTFEDARVLGLTLQVWRDVCWPKGHGAAVALLLGALTGRNDKPLWRAAHGRAYVRALEYIVRHDLDGHRPGEAGVRCCQRIDRKSVV